MRRLLYLKVIFTSFDSSIGTILLAATSYGLCRLAVSEDMKGFKTELSDTYKTDIVRNNGLLESAAEEIKEYLNGIPVKFKYKLDIKGTSFQRKVWNVLLKIPFGKTLSYKDVAQRINMPLASRAVGNACSRNLLPIIIPCHRVVSSDGCLGGYSSGIEIKKKLLEIEGISLR
ncbi:MAG TPA: cysteine methyltransferase [Deltaproteobacteria bacterium]|nr:cysteine methyltransferase [Deltaproteobacteria bacterium]